jgi:hypothetical protein
MFSLCANIGWFGNVLGCAVVDCGVPSTGGASTLVMEVFMKHKMAIAISVVSIVGCGLLAVAGTTPAQAVEPTAPGQAPSVVSTTVVKGSYKTKRSVPKSFRYNLKTPTLTGVKPQVAQVFDQRVKTLIKQELHNYAKGAATKKRFYVNKKWYGMPSWSDARFYKWCNSGMFEPLQGSFDAALYQGRYVSVVLTFTGTNAACMALGGLWVEYRTTRSVTIDTVTGQLMSLTDFTNNRDNRVNVALRRWYKTVSHEFLKVPIVDPKMTVCERPGNVMTITGRLPCGITQNVIRVFSEPVIVAWQVQNDGLHITLTADDAPRYVTLSWKDITRLR